MKGPTGRDRLTTLNSLSGLCPLSICQTVKLINYQPTAAEFDLHPEDLGRLASRSAHPKYGFTDKLENAEL